MEVTSDITFNVKDVSTTLVNLRIDNLDQVPQRNGIQNGELKMLDEITNNLMEAGVCSLEYEVKDYIITRMKEELSEVEPNSSLGNDEIFELIDFPSIVSDECWIFSESVSNSITESMDSETYYTVDCMVHHRGCWSCISS